MSYIRAHRTRLASSLGYKLYRVRDFSVLYAKSNTFDKHTHTYICFVVTYTNVS